jgi:hypothetical protein
MSNKDWKCKTCKCKIPKDERRIVVDYQSPDGLFMSDSHCLSCGQKKLIKFPGEEFFDKARFETKSVIDKLLGENLVSGINCGSIDEGSNESTKVTEDQMAEDKLTFKPDFCFVSLTECVKLPAISEVHQVTKIVKTPYGFDLYFENDPFNVQDQQILASLYGGSPRTRRLYKIGSKIDHLGKEFTFEEYVKPEFEDDHRKDNPGLHILYIKWACQHITIIDDCIKKLIRGSGGGVDGPVNSLRKERAKLIKENAAYNDAHDIMNEIRVGKGKRKLSTDGYPVEACSPDEALGE